MITTGRLTPVFALLALGLYDCGPVNTILDAGGPVLCSTAQFNVAGDTVATFGTSANALKVQAFLQASLDINTAINDVDTQLDTACRAIGTDIGLTPIPVVATDPIRSTASCTRVGMEIETILHAALPAGAHLTLQATPPVCEVDLTAEAQCSARCQGMVTVTPPMCSGTLVSVDCHGSCDGSCSGSCTGSCTGACTGTCNAQCTGTCNGTCTGTCDVMQGTTCVGHCTGMCMGSCSAGCMGSCTGGCSAGCTGSCMGECRGACTAASNFRCDGAPMVNSSVQCEAACSAQINARAHCVPGSVMLSTGATVNAAALDRFNRLIPSLQHNLPIVLALSHRIHDVVSVTVPAFQSSLQGLPNAVLDVGLSAGACVTEAITLVSQDVPKVQPMYMVTVNFSASVMVSGQ